MSSWLRASNLKPPLRLIDTRVFLSYVTGYQLAFSMTTSVRLRSALASQQVGNLPTTYNFALPVRPTQQVNSNYSSEGFSSEAGWRVLSEQVVVETD